MIDTIARWRSTTSAGRSGSCRVSLLPAIAVFYPVPRPACRPALVPADSTDLHLPGPGRTSRRTASVATAQRHRPWGGASWPAAWRSRAARIADISPGVRRPEPDLDQRADDAAHHLVAEGVGLDLEAQHAVAERRPSEPSSTRRVSEAGIRRRRGSAFGRRQNDEKSCSPMSGSQARRSALQVERRARRATRCGARNGSGHRAVEHGVAVARGPGREAGVEVVGDDSAASRTTIGGRHSWLTARCRSSRADGRAPVGRRVEAHDLAPARARRRRCARRR